jgi:hypothetical protein
VQLWNFHWHLSQRTAILLIWKTGTFCYTPKMYLRLGTWTQRWSPGVAPEIHEDSLPLNAMGSQDKWKDYYILFCSSFLAGLGVTNPFYTVEWIVQGGNIYSDEFEYLALETILQTKFLAQDFKIFCLISKYKKIQGRGKRPEHKAACL